MKQINSGFSPDYSEELVTVKQLQETQGDFILEFGAPWCGHCKAAFAAVKTILNENPNLKHLKIYDGKGKKLGREFRVKLWPTFIVMQNGEEIARVVRPSHIDELRELINQ